MLQSAALYAAILHEEAPPFSSIVVASPCFAIFAGRRLVEGNKFLEAGEPDSVGAHLDFFELNCSQSLGPQQWTPSGPL